MLETLWRHHRVRLRAALLRRLRDLDTVDEALSAAFLAAQVHWGGSEANSEPPKDPAAWLYRVALRKALDQRARAQTRHQAQDRLAVESSLSDELADDPAIVPENRLGLFFHCAHPALSEPARVALILRSCCDVNVERIAQSFFEAPATTAQRIVRAKAKLKAIGAAVEPESMGPLEDRLQTVLDVIEIIYDQSYRDIDGGVETAALAKDALQLSECLAQLLPLEPEVHGLLAILCLCESRRPSRLSAEGVLIPLSEQNYKLWDLGLLSRAAQTLETAARLARPGPLQIRALVHALAAKAVRTGTDQSRSILALYDQLCGMISGTAVYLARLSVLAEVEGAETALTAMDETDWPDSVRNSLSYWVTRADLLRRTARWQEAELAYTQALAANPGRAEARFLQERIGLLKHKMSP